MTVRDTDRTRAGDRVTIYPRGKKRIYVADFWQDNRHCRKTLKTTNKRIAVEQAIKIAAQLLEGISRPAPPNIDFRRAAADFVQVRKTDGLARKSISRFTGAFTHFALFLKGQGVVKLNAVAAGHFDSWRALRKTQVGDRMIYNQSFVVKQLFKSVKSRKLLVENVLADLTLKKPRHAPKRGPSLSEVDDILANASWPLKLWLLILACTGMRVGELQHLRVEDLDLIGNWLHIHSRPGAEAKTRVSRKVPLHPRLRAALTAFPLPKSGWLFTVKASKKYPAGDHWISPKRVNEQFQKLL